MKERLKIENRLETKASYFIDKAIKYSKVVVMLFYVHLKEWRTSENDMNSKY